MPAPASAPDDRTKSSARPRRRARLLLSILAILLLLAGASVWALAGLGRWLVVQDALAPAQAIVVLSGRMPTRAMGAAEIYQQGFAREVWITRPRGPEDIMKELGIPFVGEEEYSRMVLEQLGVPAASIRILPEPIVNTEQEVLAISSELRRIGGDRVIVVTSMPHTRRVHTIWKRLVGNQPELIVRYARQDAFDAGHWWRHTSDALDVVREVLGLMNAWAGFPVHAAASR